MSNAVNLWRKILSKNVVELRQYFSTIIFDKVLQQSTKNLSIAGEICQRLSKFTVEKSWRKFLSKNAGEKCCRIIIRQYFSTNFYSKFLGLFVKYQTKFLSKKVCKILYKSVEICRKTTKFVEKSWVFMSNDVEKCCRFLLVK